MLPVGNSMSIQITSVSIFFFSLRVCFPWVDLETTDTTFKLKLGYEWK
jgi:hypothetical protein